MYDVNKIREDFYSNRPVPVERLKELLGHTPFEVFVGALLFLPVAVLGPIAEYLTTIVH